MASPPFSRARALAIGVAALIVLGLAVACLTVDTRAASATARWYATRGLGAVTPLLFAAHRLRRRDDPLGPAVAALAGVTFLAAGLFIVSRVALADHGGYAFYMLLALFMPPLSGITAIAGLSTLLVVLLLVSAIGAWREID